MMMSEVLKMDDIDRDIIKLVQKNPSLTHTQIAKQVKRSQPTVGMRIRKLEGLGVLKFQAGINIKAANLMFAQVNLQTLNPKDILEIIKRCPFMLNAFRLSGNFNISILITGIRLSDLDKIVNVHFRNNPDVLKLTMNVITDVVNDFVLPIDLNFDHCDCPLHDHCSKEYLE